MAPRADQNYRDLCEDDREFDHDDWPARSNFGERVSVQAGDFELDPNARHRLAVARFKTGNVEERNVSFSILLRSFMLIYNHSCLPMLLSLIFMIIPCRSLKLRTQREMYAEAKPIYELLGGDPAVSQVNIHYLCNQLDYRPVASIFFFKLQHA